jgi:hypothetical protein
MGSAVLGQVVATSLYGRKSSWTGGVAGVMSPDAGSHRSAVLVFRNSPVLGRLHPLSKAVV